MHRNETLNYLYNPLNPLQNEINSITGTFNQNLNQGIINYPNYSVNPNAEYGNMLNEVNVFGKYQRPKQYLNVSPVVKAANIIPKYVGSGIKKDMLKGSLNTLANVGSNLGSTIGKSLGNFSNTVGGPGVAIDLGSNILSGGLNALGVKEADITGVGDNVLSGASKLPWEMIPGAGIPIKAALSGLNLINKHFGRTSHRHGTDGDMTSVYDLKFNQNANKKYTLFGRRARKRSNRLTSRFDKYNLTGSFITNEGLNNIAHSTNTSQILGNKNWMDLQRDSYNPNVLVAKKGNKITKGELRNIIFKAQQGSKLKKEKVVTHAMAAEADKDGQWYVYPTVDYINGKWLKFNDSWDAFDFHKQNNTLLKVPSKDIAIYFSENGLTLHDKDKFNKDLQERVDSIIEANKSLSWIDRAKNPKKYPILLESEYIKITPSKLSKGGQIQTKNVIPEGAFHSRKNKLPEEIAKHVTPKGIPVISKEGDKINQHAEIEKNEIIFHKEATNTIEKLYKKYKEAKSNKEKDEIAIECGKYVADQILINTEDRSGLLEKVNYK